MKKLGLKNILMHLYKTFLAIELELLSLLFPDYFSGSFLTASNRTSTSHYFQGCLAIISHSSCVAVLQPLLFS